MKARALVALTLITMAGCSSPKVLLAFGDVDTLVQGNVVALPVSIEGEVQIVKADGDTTGETGHFHVFIDEEPVADGKAIPLNDRGVVHSAEDPIVLWGLEPGQRKFTVVLGNGAHQRIGDYEDSTTVDVKGPSVRGMVPATIDAGDPLTIELQAWGVEIGEPNDESSKDAGHYHVIVDDEAPQPGSELSELSDTSVHTAEDEVTITKLDEGMHTVWVVLTDGEDRVVDPPVMDKFTVTVG